MTKLAGICGLSQHTIFSFMTLLTVSQQKLNGTPNLQITQLA